MTRRKTLPPAARKPPDPAAPPPFEPRRVWATPENIWTQGAFWKLANKLANQQLIEMSASGHALITASKNGAIDPAIVADSVMNMALHTINTQIPPAGNA